MELVREINKNAKLYRGNGGIAIIKDGNTGNIVSVHPNISSTGSVRGMKQLGYWDKNARTVKCGSYIYNIDSFCCNFRDELEVIVSKECNCEGCIKRRKEV